VNPHDRAVVVGIRRYVDAQPDGWITNLNGPDNDADAVAAWLRQPDGGGLPPENIRTVRSADLPDPFPDESSAGPQQRAVEDALNDVAELSSTAFEGQYAGRRLYVYVSGHGYAKQRDEAALVTAEAKRARPLNVLVSSWVDWLWNAGRFQEYVLWVDTCATRAPLAYLKPCDRSPEHSQNAANGRLFTAFAAGFDKLAVENEMPDGKWHSVFTYALLQGLRGAAQTPVTTSSLRNYLLNAMPSFMREDQISNSRVAKEPAFGRTDELVFGQPAQRSTFAVRLRFPAEWVGRRVTISVSSTSPLIAETVLAQAEWTPRLPAGVYVVFAPEHGDFHPFAVNGGDSRVDVP
jgi:Caspase domain